MLFFLLNGERVERARDLVDLLSEDTYKSGELVSFSTLDHEFKFQILISSSTRSYSLSNPMHDSPLPYGHSTKAPSGNSGLPFLR